MILQIIEDALNSRPIYFAVTVAPNNRLGIDAYLQMEGLVYKVTTEKDETDSRMPRLNYKRMTQNITETSDYNIVISNPDEYAEQIDNGNGIYRYNNLSNPDIYFNENIQRLIQNYRSSFLQLALDNLYSEKPNGDIKTLDLLKMMDTYFPPEVIPTTDPELDIQIGRIYKQAGDPNELIKRLQNIEKRKDLSLEDKVYIGQIYLNDFPNKDFSIQYYENLYKEYPYIPDVLYTLVQIYAQADKPEKAKDALELWLLSHPNDSQAIDWLSILSIKD